MSTNRNNIYKNYNPDILETIANLSNDEVFTPPKLANEILDLLPEEVWSNPNLTFLNPSVKVFQNRSSQVRGFRFKKSI